MQIYLLSLRIEYSCSFSNKQGISFKSISHTPRLVMMHLVRLNAVPGDGIQSTIMGLSFQEKAFAVHVSPSAGAPGMHLSAQMPRTARP